MALLSLYMAHIWPMHDIYRQRGRTPSPEFNLLIAPHGSHGLGCNPPLTTIIFRGAFGRSAPANCRLGHGKIHKTRFLGGGQNLRFSAQSPYWAENVQPQKTRFVDFFSYFGHNSPPLRNLKKLRPPFEIFFLWRISSFRRICTKTVKI